MIMMIGAALAAGAAWIAVGNPQWTRQVPLFLIGLALVCFGYSGVSRTRKARLRSRSTHR